MKWNQLNYLYTFGESNQKPNQNQTKHHKVVCFFPDGFFQTIRNLHRTKGHIVLLALFFYFQVPSGSLGTPTLSGGQKVIPVRLPIEVIQLARSKAVPSKPITLQVSSNPWLAFSCWEKTILFSRHHRILEYLEKIVLKNFWYISDLFLKDYTVSSIV